ncbi:MAG TPA: cytochrome c [Anaeromyxobacteraceae bacterium]|nr:cytochrome c [Anaeromyxobacteraceae bacterium]
MIPALLVTSLLLAAEPAATAPASASASSDQSALLEGKLPDEPGRSVLQAKCLICHTVEYVTLQRLTPAQWQKTVEKMRKFGAPLNDDEVRSLSAYLGKHWTVDLPEWRPRPVAPPQGALPAK